MSHGALYSTPRYATIYDIVVTTLVIFISTLDVKFRLTSKVDRRTVGVRRPITTVHRFSNESGRANWDIYGDFILKKQPFGLYGLYNNCQCFMG